MKFSKNILGIFCALIAFGSLGNIVCAEESLYVISDMDGGGTGMIALGCTAAFPYLPKEDWDVNAVSSVGEDVNEFTAEGLASGIYNGRQENSEGEIKSRPL